MNPEMTAAIIEHYGATFFFVLGFVEFIGLPVASIPALVAGGALAGMAPGAHPLVMALAAAAGGLLADTTLYGLSRWKGAVMVDAACGLTSNPRSCVLLVTDQVNRIGPLFIVGAKFIPGAGNLIAPAAALAGTGPVRFLTRDAVALVTWAGAYTAAGWVFSPEIVTGLAWAGRYAGWLIPAAVALVGLAALWRIWRVRVHTQLHSPPPDDSRNASDDEGRE